MRINANTALVTDKIQLVPYCSKHVPKYHNWMQDEELQRLTASSPLTLCQEYKMQQDWRTDTDKLTFIACTSPPSRSAVEASSEIERMVGDINLFITDYVDDEEEQVSPKQVVGEVEMMIAEPSMRGKGLGMMILLAFLCYIRSHLAVILEGYTVDTVSRFTFLRVKIAEDNVKSVRLFERAGFVRVSGGPNFFGEVELRCDLQDVKLEDEAREVPYIE